MIAWKKVKKVFSLKITIKTMKKYQKVKIKIRFHSLHKKRSLGKFKLTKNIKQMNNFTIKNQAKL
jgi:hypothetical protein